MADNAEDKAAARALELLGGHVEEEDTTEAELVQVRTEFNEGLANLVEAPSSEEEPVAEAEAQHETEPEDIELPDLNPKLPEDLAEELAMPDWDEEESEETEIEELDDDDEYEDDERMRALRARLRKAEKKAAWAEEQRAKTSRQKWSEEATKYFPLSAYALNDIKATSRRGFLREAEKAHKAVQPAVQEFIDTYAKKLAALKQEALEEGRQKATEAWGKPTVAPGGRESTTAQAREEKIQKAKTLEERIKARIFAD